MKKMKRNGQPLSCLPALLCGALIVWALGDAEMAAAGSNDAKDLSNIPMEMRQKSAPANIMYILDDSGSMHDNRVSGGNGANLYDSGSAETYPSPIAAWLFANHFSNTMYYDSSREYAPWPGLEKDKPLPSIPLNKIKAAPNWPEIPAELRKCELPADKPLRNINYMAYKEKDGSGEETRDLTATATWYTELVPVYPSQYVYDYVTGTGSGSSTTYTYNVPYGYFPGVTKNGGIPATHYFVCKDKTKSCTTVTGEPTSTLIDPRIATGNELWLVVLRYNNGQPKREFYKVSDLAPVQHISPSYRPYNPSSDPTILPKEDTRYTYELRESNLDGPYTDAGVADEVKPHWTRPDGSVYAPTPSEELGNFLQWYVYHSTRNFVTMNALATSLQELSGVNVGMYSINTDANYGGNPKLRIGVMPVKVGETDRSDYLLCRLYSYYAKDGNTPFTEAYETVGRYFDMSRTDTFVVGDDQGKQKPYEDEADGGSCQQAFVVNFTDGMFGAHPYPSRDVPYIPKDLDGDGEFLYGSYCSSPCVEYAEYEYCPSHCDQYITTADGGTVCSTGYYYLPDKSDCTTSRYCSRYDNTNQSCTDPIFYPTISDIAKYYYDNDLAPSVPNYVPTTAHDKNSQQHLVAYSVALGVSTPLLTQYYNVYRDDPYFHNHAEPDWKNSGWAYPFNSSSATGGPNYLWHASVVSKGIFYNVSDAGALTNAFRSIVANIGGSSLGVGAAAVNDGGQLNDTAAIYVGRYDTSKWTGQLAAYRISKVSGKIDTAEAMWEASEKLKDRTSRLIFTSDGKGKGLEFTTAGLSGLTAGQKEMLGYSASDPSVFASNIDYIRGNNNISGLRVRGGNKNANNILGDIIHASPVLLRSAAMGIIDPSNPDKGTIYIGANDGMLHAFNVKDGEERFAFIPSQAHDHLLALGDPKYVDNHRYYIDATPVVGRMTFFNDTNPKTRTKDMRLLVSGLGRGGRGYFALKVADITGSGASRSVKQAEDITSGTSMSSDVTDMLKWEYPTRDMIGTPPSNVTDPYLDPALSSKLLSTDQICAYQANGKNNPDGDGELLCAGPNGQALAYRDDDLGYSYSAPVIFPSNYRKNFGLGLPAPGSKEHPWVVVFGNGYGSESGRAVLYVLDALSGKLIKKIDTGSGPNNSVKNGLSSPAELDVDNDGLVDFVYAGDLYGNLWKFDFRSPDPKDWDVARDGNTPRPLFSTMQGDQPGQPITSRPNIVAHNKKKGYIIVFGTGQFIGPDDFHDTKTQSLFGIWDSDIPPSGTKLAKYLGVWQRKEDGRNSFQEATGTFPNASLLKQVVRFQGTPPGAQCGAGDCPEVRVVSNNSIKWYNAVDSANFSNVGWYLDLPGLDPISFDSAPVFPAAEASERIIDDVRIRYGKVIAVSFTPGGGVCSAGGSSALMELSAFNGGGPRKAQLNLGSGKLGTGDYFQFGDGTYTASGLIMGGKTTMPTIISGSDPRREYKVQFDNAGVMQSTLEDRPSPVFFWREASKN